MTLKSQNLLNGRLIDARRVSNDVVEDDEDDDVVDVDLALAVSHGIKRANPKAIWVASLHKHIKFINEAYKQHFVRKKKEIHRVIANHVGKTMSVPPPDSQTQKHLYSIEGSQKGGMYDLHLTHMDLYVGARVRITENICVEAGIFNGAMGTIMGFVYTKAEPPKVKKQIDYFHTIFSDVICKMIVGFLLGAEY